MRIAICEDNPAHADILKNYIEKWSEEENIHTCVSHFPSTKAFLNDRSRDNTFDLTFLNIRMSQMSGLALATQIRQTEQAMMLVFLTGLMDYVFRVYEVQAFRYLLKPIREKECMKVLTAAHHAFQNRNDDAFLIIQDTKSTRLLKREIYYFEMDHHYVIVHTTKGPIRYKEKLSNIMEALGEPHFCLCHRSYLVNLQYVDVIDGDKLRIVNGKILPVSSWRWAPMNECFISFYMRARQDAAAIEPAKG